MAKEKKKSTHYVDNRRLYTEMVKHITAYNTAKDAGEELPRLNNYIGDCLIKIADGLGSRGNYCNYIFLDEMKMDGIMDCVKYSHNFNPDKYNNPFAYFTKIMWQAFVRRIDKEKKLLYTKIKYTQAMEIENSWHPEFQKIKARAETDSEKSMNLKMAEMAERYEKKV